MLCPCAAWDGEEAAGDYPQEAASFHRLGRHASRLVGRCHCVKAGVWPGRAEDSHAAGKKFSGEIREPLAPSPLVTVIERDCLALDVAERAESLPQLPLVKHDIPNHDERVRLNIRCRGQYLRDKAVLVRTDVLQQQIFVVQRLPGKIHLRDHTVDLSCHLEVEVGRPHPVRSSRIRPWLDRLKPITALGIGFLNGEALEVGIKGCRVRVTRVGVASVRGCPCTFTTRPMA